MAWPPAREPRRRQIVSATRLIVVAVVLFSFFYLPTGPTNAVALVHSNTDLTSPLIDELAPRLPRQLSFIRRVLSALDWTVPTVDVDSHRELYHVDQGDFRPYRKWHQWLQESCFILGFSDASGHTKGGRVHCPELWVDESWPTGTTKILPAAQLMSVGGERVVVLLAKLVRQLPAEEVKAQMGRELAHLAWSPVLPLPYLYGAGRVAQWMLGEMNVNLPSLPALPVKDALSSLTPAVETLNSMSDTLSRAMSPPRATKPPPLVQKALKSRLPILLSPALPAAPKGHGSTVAQRPPAPSPKPATKPATKPASATSTNFDIAGGVRDVAAVAALSAVSAEHTRTGVVVADRVSALASGDAEAAAVAILRTKGQMPRGSSDTHRQGALLRKVVADATDNKWAWGVQEAVTASTDMHAETRVKLLLEWAKSAEGKRLMALAAARRNHFRQKRLSLKRYWRRPVAPTVSWPWPKHVQGGNKTWGRWRGIQFLLALMLLVPCTRTVDPVRWAAVCTLITTGLALLSPLQARVWPSHVMVPLLGSVFVYVYLLHGVWWNHLLGGSNRWSRLSAKFAADVADQANVTASLAYLTRHWAEMAKRSMEHLDEELCGSWRSSLHELADKLNDLQQELNAGAPSKGQTGAMQLGHTSVPMPPSFDNSADEAGGPANLWLKVDRAVQEAAQVECARMRHAGFLDDSESLRSMMTWWMADGDTQDDNMILGSDEYIAAPTETLGQMLLTEQLHQRYSYQSFHNKDAGGAVDLVEREAWPEANQFQKLEREVSLTFHSLEELRSQVSLWQDTRTALFWTYADFRRVWLEYHRAIWGPRKDSRHMHGDQQKSLTSMSCLLLAAFAGFGLAVASALNSHWAWCLGCFNFGAANGVLLLNFAKLRLPHVHRRFSQRLGQLRASREKILAEMQVAQRAAQSGGVTHLRACITYQSVNMLRNINYVASCVKAQVQRAAAEDRPWEQRRHVAMCGLQMLLTLLPRKQLLDKADALAPDDCNLALAVLHDRRRGMTLVALRNNVLLWREFASMRKKVIDAQRNLWLLFRLVHFSSAIPAEEQGQLKALLDRFIRPVLVEGRVPLGHRPDALEGVSGGHRGFRSWRVKDAAPPPDAPERRTMEVSRRSHSFCSESSFATLSCKSTVDSEQNTLDAKKMLHRLAATRADIANVLARLPPAALVDASLATCPPTGAIFTDVFSSIIVGLHPSYIPDDTADRPPNLQLTRSTSSLPQPSEPVAFAVGYSHGDQEYHLDGHIRTTLLLRVLHPKLNTNSREGVGAEAEYDVQQFSVPLSAITTDEPPREALEAAWIVVEGRLCLADGRLGESALKGRRRSLRRAKDVLRSLHGRRAP